LLADLSAGFAADDLNGGAAGDLIQGSKATALDRFPLLMDLRVGLITIN
jgi:hypothetical protein